jgi:hypothetical protein
MAPENGSTRHWSCFTLAEGDGASMEQTEVSEDKTHKLNVLVEEPAVETTVVIC